MKAHEGGKGRGSPVYNPKTKLDNSPSQMVFRPKNWNGQGPAASPAARPAKPSTSGPRPKPKRK